MQPVLPPIKGLQDCFSLTVDLDFGMFGMLQRTDLISPCRYGCPGAQLAGKANLFDTCSYSFFLFCLPVFLPALPATMPHFSSTGPIAILTLALGYLLTVYLVIAWMGARMSDS